jgi:hypothetical protein
LPNLLKGKAPRKNVLSILLKKLVNRRSVFRVCRTNLSEGQLVFFTSKPTKSEKFLFVY